jgi:UDP-2,3-diacylglucosamine pyrophosphatase LpxH
MNLRSRDVYLISDLHLGGAQPSIHDPEDRGFRICTHGADVARFITALAEKPDSIELIVNGDTVDFLAEEDESGGWSAFSADEQAAARKLDRIIDRDRELFEALRALVERGHRLTLLIGNHDIELALPAVRRRLAERIGITGRHDFHFIYDGEAYVVGRALIEHGNRYDPFNVVDHDGLRRIRSLQSRHQPVAMKHAFAAPAGSHIVAEVMNPIKSDYRLIDLLKPETGAMMPVLMALEPGYRRVLTRIAALGLRARKHRLADAALPSFAGDISSDTRVDWMSDGLASDISSSGTAPDPLTVIVRETMQSGADLVLDAAPAEPDFVGDISSRETIDRRLGLARMLASSNRATVESRLPALLAAVRSLQNDSSFARDTECFTEYFAAARDLAGNGFDFVIFGHTHIARDVALPGGARYLNTGTWADMIRFPSDILAGSERQALDGLRAFVEDMGAGRLRAWTSFSPSYVKLTIGHDGVVRDAAVHDYTSISDL